MKKGTTRARKKTTPGSRRVDRDEILPEYDFSRGRPNPYSQRYTASAKIVELDDDVAAVFPDAEAVNHALRALAGIIQAHGLQGRHEARKVRKATRVSSNDHSTVK
jgi:hypothetical protein